MLSLISAVLCSTRYNIHVEPLTENSRKKSSLADPIKKMAFDDVIVPWLRTSGELSDAEINGIKWETLSRSINPVLPPLFQNSKRLFDLVGLLLENGLIEIGTQILRFMRTSLFNSSTYIILIESLHIDVNFDDNPGKLAVFKQILKIWFPRPIDIVSVIHNIVDLRMGEDSVLLLIDLTWDGLFNYRPATDGSASNEFIDHYFSKILMSAMSKQYVSVFEDILERRPGLIEYIHKEMGRESTIIHQFCRGIDPQSLNKLKVVKGWRSAASVPATAGSVAILNPKRSPHPDIPPYPIEKLYLDHRSRSYPNANADLLAIMIRFGADINARDYNNYTPLHTAICLKNAHIFRVLVEAGADYTVDVHGMNIYAFLIANYSSEVEKVFYELLPVVRPNRYIK